jgi:NADH-quinone oxidoreductase subunit H
MRWLRGLVPTLIALAVVWLLATGGSGAREVGLVSLRDMTPRQVELGDRIGLVGDGFPPGQVARVTFEGTLHRPGEHPVRAAQIVLSGSVRSPGQVELAFGDEAQALFCGAADRAAHTTFEGSVEVAFAPAIRGAPPIVGILPRMVLDVRPSVRSSDVASEREGARLLAWAGVRASPGASGLLVESVEDASRARAAGIESGDVIATFDGVRVSTTADVVPAPGEREATVGVRRAGWVGHGGAAWHDEDLVVRTLSVVGFRRAPPVELLAAALVVLGALVVVFLFGAPNGLMRSSRLQRAGSRVAARVRALPGGRSLREKMARALAGVARSSLPPAGAPVLVDALACGLLAALPFGQYLIAAQLDVGLLFVAAAATAAAAAFAASGSLGKGLRASLHAVWHHVPAAAAVASVVFTTGSLRVQEIERAQGGWPWDWLAFRSPAALVALGVLLASARVDLAGPRELGPVERLLEDDGMRSPRGPWLEAACRAHGILVAGLASVLFLGGWLLPGFGAGEQDARPLLELAGAVWLLAKTSGIFLLTAWVRWALPAQPAAERTRATAWRLAPLAVLAFGATALWTWWGPARTVQLLVSGALVAVVALAAVAVALRLRHSLLAPSSDGRLSPFL